MGRFESLLWSYGFFRYAEREVKHANEG